MLLAEAREAGIGVWLDGGDVRLRAAAPPAPELLERLRAAKAEIVAILSSGQPPWHDDRAWIARWRDAGPTLAEREPVLRAWLAAAPAALPAGLPAVELRRIARNHGIALPCATAHTADIHP